MQNIYWTDKLYPCALDEDGVTARQLSDKMFRLHEMAMGITRAAKMLLEQNTCLESEDAGLVHMIESVGEKLSGEIGDLLPDGVKDSPTTQP